jgi:ABC-type xylose transport system permease subunit
MVSLKVSAPVQDVVLGIVLVTAVAIDTSYRRRAAQR